MSVFVDTSAIIAFLAKAETQHRAAVRHWEALRSSGEPLVTSNYVLLETIALATRRLGLDAVHDIEADAVPLMDVHWVDRDTHARAVAALLAARRRDLSLVDCVSFEVMRSIGIRDAFAFDSHFAEYGFQVIP